MRNMNAIILSAAGREDGDRPRPIKPDCINGLLLDAIPKDEQLIFKKREE